MATHNPSKKDTQRAYESTAKGTPTHPQVDAPTRGTFMVMTFQHKCRRILRKRGLGIQPEALHPNCDDPGDQKTQAKLDPPLCFAPTDSEDIFPHEDDRIVILVITIGCKVHRVLMDQGNSVDIMFRETFLGLLYWLGVFGTSVQAFRTTWFWGKYGPKGWVVGSTQVLVESLKMDN